MNVSLTLPLKGMNCSACAIGISERLNELPGVEAEVNFTLERAQVNLQGDQSIKTVVNSLADQGYGTETSRLTATVQGMTCAGCAGKIEKALQAHPLVLQAEVNFATEKLSVEFVSGSLSFGDVRELVESAGYRLQAQGDTARARKAELQQRDQQVMQDYRQQRNRVLLSWLLTLPLLAGMVTMFAGLFMDTPPNAHLSPWLEWLLATPVQFFIGARYYRGAWRSLSHGSANMDVLVATGTSAAYFYSVYLLLSLGHQAMGQLYFEASAVVITLITTGKWLETRARRSTTSAIRELMALRPDSAWVRRDGDWLQVDVDDISSGETVRVRAGEKVPVDGEITEGASDMDESLVTGESLPVAKSVGDAVIAGSVNGANRLILRATAVGEDTSLARIIKLVEQAQTGKAPIQQLVDKVSGIFVPVVIAIAVVTFVAWWALSGDFANALISAVAVLVIACPCALGLATPAAIVTGTGAAARHGILIKDVDTLQKAHRLNAVVFDKTGTLTVGQPRVVARFGDESKLPLAASLQRNSDHPLAQAMVAAAQELVAATGADSTVTTPGEASEVQTLAGYGIVGQVDGAAVAIGNAGLMEQRGITVPDWDLPAVFAQSTRVWLAVDGEVTTVLALADELRTESAEAVQQLHQRGIKTWLISGDVQGPVDYIAGQLQLDGAYAEVKPEQKAAQLKQLREKGLPHIAMVGDGINDAPALAEADVGIAMGSGTDVAMETASITLMRSDPRLVADAIDISAATWRKIKQNLFWAFVFNAIGIPLAAFGLLSPVVAGAAMAMSSIMVLGNSLLLTRWRPRADRGRPVPPAADLAADKNQPVPDSGAAS